MADRSEDGRGPLMDNATAKALSQIADGLETIIKGIRALSSASTGVQCNYIPTDRNPDYPCVRHDGHTGNHHDRKGGTFS